MVKMESILIEKLVASSQWPWHWLRRSFTQKFRFFVIRQILNSHVFSWTNLLRAQILELLCPMMKKVFKMQIAQRNLSSSLCNYHDNRWWVFLWLDWKSCQQSNAFSFCGLFMKTPGSRNVHKSRRSSPIWYLFSLSPRRDYLVTHLVIIFPSHPSQLLHPSWFSCNLSPACFCLFVDNFITKYHIIKSHLNSNILWVVDPTF